MLRQSSVRTYQRYVAFVIVVCNVRLDDSQAYFFQTPFAVTQETEFVPNMVRTAKYEYYNFLPKFLWEEFNPATKIANVYFLFIAALQASKRCWHTSYNDIFSI